MDALPLPIQIILQGGSLVFLGIICYYCMTHILTMNKNMVAEYKNFKQYMSDVSYALKSITNSNNQIQENLSELCKAIRNINGKLNSNQKKRTKQKKH